MRTPADLGPILIDGRKDNSTPITMRVRAGAISIRTESGERGWAWGVATARHGNNVGGSTRSDFDQGEGQKLADLDADLLQEWRLGGARYLPNRGQPRKWTTTAPRFAALLEVTSNPKCPLLDETARYRAESVATGSESARC